MAYASKTEFHSSNIRLTTGSIFSNVNSSIEKLFQVFSSRCIKFLKAAQLNRMNSVLMSMPDHVLDEIGITRSEIPEHARKILSEKTDPQKKTVL